ncbi:MAG: ammonium transporter, partial [Actinobacteria bacterium]|nr:ammonium transporter [Actinomycetota bacterium]
MGGIGLVLGGMWAFQSFLGGAAAHAQSAAPSHGPNDFVNPINTVWVLVTAFLVFFMQAGFMALEAGFARSRETVNV